MMKLLTVAAALTMGATLSAGAAIADPKVATGAENPDKPTGAKAAPSDQRYCIEDTVIGSRIRQRECKTRAEWMKDGFDPLNP